MRGGEEGLNLTQAGGFDTPFPCGLKSIAFGDHS